jgi:hypothetical protein
MDSSALASPTPETLSGPDFVSVYKDGDFFSGPPPIGQLPALPPKQWELDGSSTSHNTAQVHPAQHDYLTPALVIGCLLVCLLIHRAAGSIASRPVTNVRAGEEERFRIPTWPWFRIYVWVRARYSSKTFPDEYPNRIHDTVRSILKHPDAIYFFGERVEILRDKGGLTIEDPPAAVCVRTRTEGRHEDNFYFLRRPAQDGVATDCYEGWRLYSRAGAPAGPMGVISFALPFTQGDRLCYYRDNVQRFAGVIVEVAALLRQDEKLSIAAE